MNDEIELLSHGLTYASSGLVQDCVVAGVSLSMRGTLFDKEDYFQMVSVALQDHYAPVYTLPPAIVKPKRMWTGKQIFSTVIQNLIPNSDAFPSFNFKTSVKKEVCAGKTTVISSP